MKSAVKKQTKFKIKSGDLVKVVAGDSKGSQGKVVSVITKKDRVLIEGVNMVTKHQKPSATNPEGGILKVEAPVHISNVALVDPLTGTTTRVGRKLDAQGKLVRFAKKSGQEIK